MLGGSENHFSIEDDDEEDDDLNDNRPLPLETIFIANYFSFHSITLRAS